MAKKPSIPKGTRDFSPQDLAKRNYIFNSIKTQFELFGFQPIETPSFENSDTLLGKYGEEGDRLIFKILNSGDFISKVDDITYSSKNSSSIAPKITEKALRYDLTVPFARYVVMHQNEIDFPFKRYQIQPVWRADRPQKGRFREFYQCDADVVGANSILQEIELVQLYDAVFTNLGLEGVTIKVNHRKIINGISEVIGAKNLLGVFMSVLDKYDKIGLESVLKEMQAKGIPINSIDKATSFIKLEGTNDEKFSFIDSFINDSKIGLEGIKELKDLFSTIDSLGLKSTKLELDFKLARGLDYYTGAIFEVAAPIGVQMGSIGGGGRYDNLTGIFGLKDVSGVGISFGLDRIYLVMEELNLFPEEIKETLQVLCLNFGDKESLAALKLVSQLREQGIKADLYPTYTKVQKQFKYADKCNVPFVILLGEKELSENKFIAKNMKTGEQKPFSLENPKNFLLDF